jgi:hypothetical protein
VQPTCCTACILIDSTSTSVGAPLAPRHGLDVEVVCLGQATCRPCTTSRRAIQAQSGSYHDISCASCTVHAFNIRIELMVLVVYPTSPHYDRINLPLCLISNVPNLRGNSSSRFSKNLLPYLSMPINVPALVSPVSCQPHQCFLPYILVVHTDMLQVRAIASVASASYNEDAA